MAGCQTDASGCCAVKILSSVLDGLGQRRVPLELFGKSLVAVDGGEEIIIHSDGKSLMGQCLVPIVPVPFLHWAARQRFVEGPEVDASKAMRVKIASLLEEDRQIRDLPQSDASLFAGMSLADVSNFPLSLEIK